MGLNPIFRNTLVAAGFAVSHSSGAINAATLQQALAMTEMSAPGMPPPSNATGEPWAIALVMGMFSVAVVFSLFVLFWALAWLWDEIRC